MNKSITTSTKLHTLSTTQHLYQCMIRSLSNTTTHNQQQHQQHSTSNNVILNNDDYNQLMQSTGTKSIKTHNPQTGNPLSRYTLKRRATYNERPWSISKDELQKIYKPYNTSASILRKAIPIEKRIHKPNHVMQILRTEERNRVLHEYPRYIEDFNTGDHIMLTTYISLYQNKFERISGVVLQRHGGNSLTAKFTIRNVKDDEPYELTYLLHSPWIREIIVIHKTDRHHRNKMWHIRDEEVENYTIGMGNVTVGYSEEEQKERDAAAARLKQQQQSKKKK